MDLDGRIEDRLGSARADLGARTLRTPRDPRETFSDDPLRMLRAIRFAAQLDFRLDSSLPPAMRVLKARLRPPVVSAERVADELRKMLTSPRPGLAVDLMNDCELLEVVLPEVAACWAVKQGGWHTHDVYGHTVLTLENSPPELTTRLAALLHDIGKPATASPDGSFHQHEVVGAQMAEEVLRRLRFSHAEAARVAHVVKLHLRPVYYQSDWSEGAVRRLARDAGSDLWTLMDLARADMAASAYPDRSKLDELEERLQAVLQEQPNRLQAAISGVDIMRELNLAPGPRIGRIRGRLQELVTDGELEPSRESVVAYLRAHPELGTA
jgi:poly(A) polymerase